MLHNLVMNDNTLHQQPNILFLHCFEIPVPTVVAVLLLQLVPLLPFLHQPVAEDYLSPLAMNHTATGFL